MVYDPIISLHSLTEQIKQVSDGKQGTLRVSHCILTTCAEKDEEEFDLMEDKDCKSQ